MGNFHLNLSRRAKQDKECDCCQKTGKFREIDEIAQKPGKGMEGRPSFSCGSLQPPPPYCPYYKWWIRQLSTKGHYTRMSVFHLCHGVAFLISSHTHMTPHFGRFLLLRSVGYESRNSSKLPPFRFRSQLHLDSSCHKNSHTTVQCG